MRRILKRLSNLMLLKLFESVIREIKDRNLGGWGFSSVLNVDLSWLLDIYRHIENGGDPTQHPKGGR